MVFYFFTPDLFYYLYLSHVVSLILSSWTLFQQMAKFTSLIFRCVIFFYFIIPADYAGYALVFGCIRCYVHWLHFFRNLGYFGFPRIGYRNLYIAGLCFPYCCNFFVFWNCGFVPESDSDYKALNSNNLHCYAYFPSFKRLFCLNHLFPVQKLCSWGCWVLFLKPSHYFSATLYFYYGGYPFEFPLCQILIWGVFYPQTTWGSWIDSSLKT